MWVHALWLYVEEVGRYEIVTVTGRFLHIAISPLVNKENP